MHLLTQPDHPSLSPPLVNQHSTLFSPRAGFGFSSLAFQERIFPRVSGSLRASRPPQTRAEKARKMGMILVMPMKAAKMKLPMIAANLQIPFRIPNAVPLLESERERLVTEH